MFTGLIEELGIIRSITPNTEGKMFKITARQVLQKLQPGDSVAIDGVCLSVVEIGQQSFTVQVVRESLNRTTLDSMQISAAVNLERAARADSCLGGHIIQGHVDGVAKVSGWQPIANSANMQLEIPTKLLKYIVEKGSLAVNGVSLTVAQLEHCLVRLALIPLTLQTTNLGRLRMGDLVNLEVDILAKYVENFEKCAQKEPISLDAIHSWGYKKH
jgi:riboflavin synthase